MCERSRRAVTRVCWGKIPGRERLGEVSAEVQRNCTGQPLSGAEVGRVVLGTPGTCCKGVLVTALLWRRGRQ